MTLWWILDIVLLVVVVPVVVVLLNNVLKEAKGIVPSVNRITMRGAGRLEGPRRRPAAADHADAGTADGRERRRVRRLARRDPGRRLMPAPGVLLLITVVLIVLALVYFLVSTIFALKQIADGLDETITAVGEIIAKTEPVAPVVDDINANLDAAVDALEGLLVKKAGMEDAVGLVEGIYPGAAAAGLPRLPRQRHDEGAADLRGLHARHADARAARPRGTDRGAEPEGRPGAAQRARRQPGGAQALSRRAARALAGHRHQRTRAIRGT